MYIFKSLYDTICKYELQLLNSKQSGPAYSFYILVLH